MVLIDRLSSAIVLICAVFIVGAIYSLGADGPFLLDDFHNLAPLGTYGGVDDLADVFRYVFGPQGDEVERSLSKLTFLINDNAWPAEPTQFKFTNIAIHLISGLLLFLVLDRAAALGLLGSSVSWQLPLLASVIWVLLPMHVSTVLYVVQRMTLLMSMFALASIYFFILAREFFFHPRKWVFLSLSGIFAVASVLSKESGVVLLLLYPLIEFMWPKFPGQPQARLFRSFVFTCLVLFLVLYVYAVQRSWPFYDARVFSYEDRILNQGVVLYEYISMQLAGFANYTLFHDDQEWNIGSQSVYLALVCWVGHGITIFGACKYHRRWPVLSFAVLWFYICQVLESTLLPLELMFEHRNYLASVGVVLVLSWGVIKFADMLKEREVVLGAYAVLFLPVCLYAILLVYQVSLWADYRILSSKWAADSPRSLRAQYAFTSMLSSSGMELMGMQKLEEVQREFNDPAIRMRLLFLSCKLNGKAPQITPEGILKGSFSSGVLHQLDLLDDGDVRECVDASVDGGLIALYQAVAELPLLAPHPRYFARYFDMAGDFYIRNKRYDLALKARENAFKYQPSLATSMKIVELAILGGDLKLANEQLMVSYKLNGARWYNDPIAEANLSNLQTILESQE